MSHILLIGSNNWADEIDLDFFVVMTKFEWEQLKAETQRAFEEKDNITIGIGTNEEVELSSYNDWLNQFKVKEISADEYSFFIMLFGDKVTWGFGAGYRLISGPAAKFWKE